MRRGRIGSVPYLNARPLTVDLETDLIVAPPRQRAEMLREGRIDAALISVTEVLLRPGYRMVDEIGVVSHGAVLSVFVAHRIPLEDCTEIFVDSASLTSVRLLEVLMKDRGIHQPLVPLFDYGLAHEKDAVLLIGDPAIRFARKNRTHAVWDLGRAWWEMTGLPFVYAVWAVREEAVTPPLLWTLWEAMQRGLKQLETILDTDPRFDRSFRAAYVGGAIRYDLGEREKAGLQAFADRLRRIHPGDVTSPCYVSVPPRTRTEPVG